MPLLIFVFSLEESFVLAPSEGSPCPIPGGWGWQKLLPSFSFVGEETGPQRHEASPGSQEERVAEQQPRPRVSLSVASLSLTEKHTTPEHQQKSRSSPRSGRHPRGPLSTLGCGASRLSSVVTGSLLCAGPRCGGGGRDSGGQDTP